jgi:hypothetical protein
MDPAGQLDMSQDGYISTKSLFTIEKLQDNGGNWVLYKKSIYHYLCGEGFHRHIEGTAKKPVKPGGEKVDADALEKYEEDLDAWQIKQSKVHTIITNTIPKTLRMDLLDKEMAAELWLGLKACFDNQSGLVKSDLFTRLNAIKCEDGGDALITIQQLQKC